MTAEHWRGELIFNSTLITLSNNPFTAPSGTGVSGIPLGLTGHPDSEYVGLKALGQPRSAVSSSKTLIPVAPHVLQPLTPPWQVVRGPRRPHRHEPGRHRPLAAGLRALAAVEQDLAHPSPQFLLSKKESKRN